ncbi:MAG: sugar transferase [Bacteroidota bacterium]|nr:sugar transferase [Bacteroidota bacterium]
MTKVFLEALSVSSSWILFFFYRKLAIDGLAFHEGLSSLQDKNLYFGILANGILWIIVSFITGRYDKVFVEGRLAKLVNLLAATLLSSLVLYFVLFIDDGISTPSDYYHILLAYACLQLILVSLSNGVFRMLLTIQFFRNKYHTIVRNIGGIQEEINSKRVRGILYRDATTEVFNSVEWKNEFHGPSQVWRVFEPMDLKALNVEQINALVKNQVELRLYHRSSKNHPFRQSMDYSLGRYYCAPLTPHLSGWQKANKRAMDISLSLLGLLLGIPLFVLCIVGVKSTSKGPILYTQERIGLHKKPFRIYKFRSMIIDAEKDGPQLSSEKDHRITSWGHSMRKWRLDELPQLWNVLKGDMSLVGPRPERAFYVQQIQEKEALHARIYITKPGLTSLGMVKFGYARNLEEIMERMRYDMIYLDNQSIFFDLQILLFTIRTVILGKGI